MTENKELEKPKPIFYISYFDITITIIILVSIVSQLLLVIGEFKPLLAVIVSLLSIVIVAYLFILRKDIQFTKHSKKHIFSILSILLLALIFRSEPYHYIIGGQDEGIYVNMSVAYENTGKVFQYDNVRVKLDDEEIKKIYDKNNLKFGVHGEPTQGKAEGSYLPGIYLADQSQSKYVFQFYHLHPLWMSIFGKIFGDINRIYSLVFFSLISIIAFYLILYEVTKNYFLSFSMGVLLAVNPLHAFFSKFPVTEVMSLALTSSAFYYLIKYYNFVKKDNKYVFSYLILSALLFGCMFFVRMNGFMYVPFFYSLLLTIIIFIDNKKLYRHLLSYIFVIFFILSLSIMYGLNFSYPYVSEMYSQSFMRLFGEHWKSMLLILILFLFIFIIIVYFIKNSKYLPVIKKIILIGNRFLIYLFSLVIIFGLYEVYILGFTDKYVGDGLLDLRWNMAHNSWESIRFSSLYVAIIYLSPFISLLFLYALYSRDKTSALHSFMLIFLIGFWAYILILQKTIPYQYYYARYILSEVLPYSLMFSLIVLHKYWEYIIKRFIIVSLLMMSIMYSLYYSSVQFQGKEADGAYDSLKRVANYIDSDDLLLIKRDKFKYYNEIKTPLVYYYNKNVFSFYNDNELNKILQSNVLSQYNDIFILTQLEESLEDFKSMDVIKYKQGIYERTKYIPKDFFYITTNMNLYKLDKLQYLKTYQSKNKIIKIKNNNLVDIDGMWSDQIWSKEQLKISNIDIPINNEKYLMIKTYGYHPYKNQMDKLNIKMNVNSLNQKFLYMKNNIFVFELNPSIKKINDIEIYSNVFIPKEMGMNKDGRKLGMDIKSITFKKGE